jgi:hypothetical protein
MAPPVPGGPPPPRPAAPPLRPSAPHPCPRPWPSARPSPPAPAGPAAGGQTRLASRLGWQPERRAQDEKDARHHDHNPRRPRVDGAAAMGEARHCTAPLSRRAAGVSPDALDPPRQAARPRNGRPDLPIPGRRHRGGPRGRGAAVRHRHPGRHRRAGAARLVRRHQVGTFDTTPGCGEAAGRCARSWPRSGRAVSTSSRRARSPRTPDRPCPGPRDSRVRGVSPAEPGNPQDAPPPPPPPPHRTGADRAA